MSALPTTPKPVEQLQAQVSVYADSLRYMDDPSRAYKLLESAASLTLGQIIDTADSDHIYHGPNFHTLRNGEITPVNKGDVLPLFKGSEYRDILKDSDKREKSKVIAQFFQGYHTVSQSIENAGILGLPLTEAKGHPNFLAYGGSEQVFVLEVIDPDGKPQKLAVRYGQLSDESTGEAIKKIQTDKMNRRINTLAAGKGIEGLEQGVAASIDPPVVVTEFVEGKELYKMPFEVRQAIPEEHIARLRDTIENATLKGIEIDFNTDNFIYNPESGFAIVDYRGGNGFKDIVATRNRDGFIELLEKLSSEAPIVRN